MYPLFGLILVACGGAPVVAQQAQDVAAPPAYELGDAYVKLRQTILSKAGSGPDDAAPGGVLAVLMDWALDEAVATQMCSGDGTVSLYFSHGGGFLGLGETPSVRTSCAALIEAAPAAMANLKRVSEASSLPPLGHVQFVVVTETGLWAATAERAALIGSHALSPLFRKADDLTTAIRLAMESQ